MKERNRLLILSEDSKIYAEMIKELDFQDLDFFACDTVEEAKKYLEDCNIILGEPVRVEPVLEAAKRLQWLQSTWAGADALLSPDKRTDYVLTGVKGVFGPQISEYVFAYILALERNVFEVFQNNSSIRINTIVCPASSIFCPVYTFLVSDIWNWTSAEI